MSAALDAEALALANARRAAVASAQGPAIEPSAATDAAGSASLGEFGGIALREIRADGRLYMPGAIIAADVISRWRPANRAAMQRQGKIAFFKAPIAITPVPTEGAA